MIPGIGEGSASVFFAVIKHHQSRQGQTHLLSAVIYLAISVAGLTIPIIINSIAGAIFGGGVIPDTVPGTIINDIISGNPVTLTIHIPGIGSGQAAVQLS